MGMLKGESQQGLKGCALAIGIRTAGSHSCLSSLLCVWNAPKLFHLLMLFTISFPLEPESAKTIEKTCKVGDFIENSLQGIFSLSMVLHTSVFTMNVTELLSPKINT